MISQRVLVLVLLTCGLAACGGGGGGSGAGNDSPGTTPPPGSGTPNNPPPPPPPPPDPVVEAENNARNARLLMTQIPTQAGAQLLITWVDMFDDELGYQVQRRIGDGNWESAEAQPPLDGGTGVWTRAVTVSARYRVVALLEGRSLPLHSSGDETEIYIDVDPARLIPTIQFDQSEPVRGPVQVSMQNAEGALSVTYSIEGAIVAQASSGGAFSATIPAQHLVDGTRSILAVVQKSAGLRIPVSRGLTVDNPAPAVLLNFTFMPPPDQTMLLRARASSDAGITAVEFFVNGNSMQVVSAPESQGEYAGQYVYSLDQTTLPPGPTVFRAVARDSTAATAVMERTFTIDRAPTLNVTGLFDGMIASGNSVVVRGEFGDETPGATLTISAGDVRLMWTQTSPFAATLSLAGVPAGEHSVTVRVRDVLGKVNTLNYNIIVPSTSLSYQLLDSDVERMLAVDQGSLLYRKHSGEVVLRNAAGVATQLPAASAGFAVYQMTQGRIVTWNQDSHIYLLDASWQPTDLTPQGGFTGTTGAAVRGPWVSWMPANATSMFKLYNLQTGVLRDVPVGGTLTVQRPELIATPGNEQLLFRATIDGTPGIYRHNLVTNATQLIASGEVHIPRTDGNRILWSDYTQSPPSLVAAPVSNPTASTVLSAAVTSGVIHDGVACWMDRQHNLFVNDGSVTTQLASPVSYLLQSFALNDGQVIFAEEGQMRVWSAARGERTWLDTTALAIQADGVAYFLTGSSGTLYRVTLP